ncbi:PP2C family protein-serine/threonine phosphatase [Crenobacter intestini]|nr:protein phosphatase 2C domain-containing protein [Crenobacter intestini]
MLEVAYTQHRGKRNPRQQDALWNGAACLQQVDAEPAVHALGLPVWLAVADGVASSPSAERASLLVVEALAKRVPEQGLSARTLRTVHGTLCDRYARGATFGSSTTVVAAQWTADGVTVLNCGDSRAYLIAGAGGWTRLSHDHTVLNELIAAGQADPGTEYASLYHALSDCLVADHDEDRFAIHQAKASPVPGDCLLLCSDGVHDTLGEARLKALFDPALSLSQQVSLWREAVLAAGAPDNFSLILARWADSTDKENAA